MPYLCTYLSFNTVGKKTAFRTDVEYRHEANFCVSKMACFNVLLYNNVPGTVKNTNYHLFS